MHACAFSWKKIALEPPAETPAKTISRTIVRINPTKSHKNACFMGKYQLKKVMAGQYRTVDLEKSE